MRKIEDSHFNDPKSPLPWKTDKLDRKGIAQTLTTVLSGIEQPFVVGIDAPFGCGKSHFIANWHEQLKQGYTVNPDGELTPSDSEKYRTVLINAWETDFSGDPMIALLYEIGEKLFDINFSDDADSDADSDSDPTSQSDAEQKKILRRKAILDVAKNVVYGSIARFALGGTVRNTTLADAEKEFKGKGTNSVNVFTGEVSQTFSEFKNAKERIITFKDALHDFFLDPDIEHGKKRKPVIIFIDELDRCRPTYAVEFLECIKHLFGIEGFIFVFAVNKQALISSCKKMYGETLDGDGYLRRFFDWEYVLPEPDREKYIKYLEEYFKLEEIRNYQLTSQHKKISYFTKNQNLSLRDINKFFSELNIYVRAMHRLPLISVHEITIISLLKKFKPCILNDLIHQKTDLNPTELFVNINDVNNNELFDNIIKSLFSISDDFNSNGKYTSNDLRSKYFYEKFKTFTCEIIEPKGKDFSCIAEYIDNEISHLTNYKPE